MLPFFAGKIFSISFFISLDFYLQVLLNSSLNLKRSGRKSYQRNQGHRQRYRKADCEKRDRQTCSRFAIDFTPSLSSD